MGKARKARDTAGSTAAGVRNVVRASPQRVVGQVAWVKGEQRKNVPWQSRPERDALKIMAASPIVRTAISQPFTTTYFFNEEEHEYTPDYLVGLNEQSFILEVKEDKELSQPEVQGRLRAIGQTFADEGRDFRIWTEQEYRREPLLSNSNFVLRFRGYPFSEAIAVKVRRLLASQKSLATSQIQSLLGDEVTPGSLLAMVCFGLIDTDCTVALGSDPVFRQVLADCRCTQNPAIALGTCLWCNNIDRTSHICPLHQSQVGT